MSQDREHLHLLSIFHYVVAGIAFLASLFPVIHLALGIAMVNGAIDGNQEEAAVAGWLFIAFSSAFILLGFTFATCLVLAGRRLARARGYTFCLVIAALACAFAPFGTVLGVFTLIVLLRDSVRELFGVRSASAPAEA